jgi:transcriptional regulator GlxA family with amidase domain
MSSDPKSYMQAVFIVPPKVHLLDISGPAHIFYEAVCYGASVNLFFCTISSHQTESVSSSTLSFHHLTPYDQLELNPGDLVFVPGLDFSLLSDKQFMIDSRPFQNWLKAEHLNGVTICSVCTGAFLLAAAGLLDGRSCTTHWKYGERFKQLYPKARFQTNRLFVQEDRIYTSAGVSSGIDLALYLTEQLWGASFAARIAKEVVIYFRRTLNDPQLSIYTQYRNHMDDRIHTVQDIISQTMDYNFSIDELAARVNMSVRNLTRSFKKTTQITIGGYAERLRAERARQLINEGHTLQATALHCGFKSVNGLKHLLHNHLSSGN